MFSLNRLSCFIAVAEELHFGRAAERLKMTQPPLSRQIQKLERMVGAQLLDRDNRRVALTAAGTALVAHGYVDQGTADSAVGPIAEELLGVSITLGAAWWSAIRARLSHIRWAQAWHALRARQP